MRKSILSLLVILSVFLFSCEKEELEVPTDPITQDTTSNSGNNNTGGFQYTGDNILGYWTLDSAMIVHSNYSTTGIYDTIMRYDVSDEMEIYYTEAVDKWTYFPEGSSVWFSNDKRFQYPVGSTTSDYTIELCLFGNSFSDEKAYYDNVATDCYRYVEITDVGINNQLLVYAYDPNEGIISFREFWSRK